MKYLITFALLLSASTLCAEEPDPVSPALLSSDYELPEPPNPLAAPLPSPTPTPKILAIEVLRLLLALQEQNENTLDQIDDAMEELREVRAHVNAQQALINQAIQDITQQ